MTEIWKSVEGYEGLYEVSNFGRVKSLGNEKTRKEKILKVGENGCGYMFVTLSKEGKIKPFLIHRLVAAAFLPNPEKLPQINHRDEDKTNNCVENLEWCTRDYNNNYGTRNDRVAKALINGKTSKRVICEETGEIFPSTMEVQRQLGFANTHISDCCNGKLRTCGGFHWRYVE